LRTGIISDFYQFSDTENSPGNNRRDLNGN
jgi:hypothetical protein